MKSMFRVVLVMDIFDRRVVLAKGGTRKEYRPVSDSSLVCSTSDPLKMVELLQPREVYFADLNRLQSIGPYETNIGIISEVTQSTNTMLDFGISSLEDADEALSIADTAVIGTETGTLLVIKSAASGNPGRISISIDLKHGKVLKKDTEIPEKLFKIVKILNALPLKDLIFLDLDRVGTASGFDPVFLKKLVKCSKHDVLLAGGVRDMEDLYTLEKLGIKGALIATAVHSGQVSPVVLSLGLNEGNK